MQRVTSGMEKLDRLMGGGLPLVPDIVFSGSKEDVHMLSQRLLVNRLNAGDVCVYGTVSRTREEVQDDLTSMGWDMSPFLEGGTLRILDYFSLAEEEPRTPRERLEALSSMDKKALDPEMIRLVFAKAVYGLRDKMPDRRFLSILDSIDALLLLFGLESTLLFKKMTFNVLKDAPNLGVGLLCNEFLSEEIVESVRTASGVFIELGRGRDEKPIFRVTKDIYADWMPLF